MRKFASRRLARLDRRTTALLDSGATDIFLTKDTPMVNIVTNAQPIKVGAAAGPPILTWLKCAILLFTVWMTRGSMN